MPNKFTVTAIDSTFPNKVKKTEQLFIKQNMTSKILSMLKFNSQHENINKHAVSTKIDSQYDRFRQIKI